MTAFKDQPTTTPKRKTRKTNTTRGIVKLQKRNLTLTVTAFWIVKINTRTSRTTAVPSHVFLLMPVKITRYREGLSDEPNPVARSYRNLTNAANSWRTAARPASERLRRDRFSPAESISCRVVADWHGICSSHAGAPAGAADELRHLPRSKPRAASLVFPNGLLPKTPARRETHFLAG